MSPSFLPLLFTSASKLPVDLLVYPYLSISFPRHTGQAMKQEVEPSLMHDSSVIHSQLRIQYPYFDLCKGFVSQFHVGFVT